MTQEKPAIARFMVATCAWQRHQVLVLFMESYLRNRQELMNEGIELQLLIAGDYMEDPHCYTVFQAMNDGSMHWVNAPNRPLGKKWNRLVQASRNYTYDYIMLKGSDDIVSSGLYRQYLQLFRQGYNYLGLRDCYIMRLRDRQCLYWPGYSGRRKGESAGIGRCMTRRLMEKVDFTPFDNKLDRNLDGSLTGKFKRFRKKAATISCMEKGIVAMDVKSSVNIQPFEKLRGRPVDADLLLPVAFGTDIHQLIHSLSNQ